MATTYGGRSTYGGYPSFRGVILSGYSRIWTVTHRVGGAYGGDDYETTPLKPANKVGWNPGVVVPWIWMSIGDGTWYWLNAYATTSVHPASGNINEMFIYPDTFLSDPTYYGGWFTVYDGSDWWTWWSQTAP